MRSLRAWAVRLGGIWNHHRDDRDLADELDAHLQHHIHDNLRAGMSPAEARRQAFLKFGGLDLVTEQYRDRRSVPIFDHFLQDARYGLRTLRKNPAFTAAAVLTLALGIGVNTAMFSFSDATAFRPPDVPRPHEIVRLFESTKDWPYGQVSYPDYVDYRQRVTTLAGVVAYDADLVALSKNRDEIPQLLGAWLVSSNFFSVLDVAPSLGRGFREEEDRPGAPAVAVISHRFWERGFQSDPRVIGTHVTLGTREFTIVGVAPATFAGTELFFHPDVYVPLALAHEIESTIRENVMQDRSDRWLNVMGRLKSGTPAHAASVEVSALARALEQSYPNTNQGRTAIAMPEVNAREKLDEGGYDGAALQLGLVGLVLVIACANVANLLLSRATGRGKEIAVRLAIGASRGRLIRQLLTESLLLALIGGVLGLIVADGGIHYLSRAVAANFATSDLPISMDIRLDQRVLLFALGSSLATSILFGLMPAFQSTRIDLVPALKAVAKSGGHLRWLSLRNTLVAAQIGLSVIVLTVAGLSIRGFVDKMRADPGFKTDHVLLLSFNPALVHYSADQTKQFYKELATRTAAVPGVAAAGLAQYVPLGVIGGPSAVVIEGYQMPANQDRLSIASNVVDDGYWRAMRTTIIRGRAFDKRDTSSSPNVAIVNDTMARRYWPNQDALGKVVHLGDRSGPAMQVVGIAQDGKYGYLAEPQQPYLFMPASQHFRGMMTMIVLAKGDPSSLTPPIRAAVQALGATVPVFDVRTLDNLYQSRALMPARLVSRIMTSLGILAVVLVVIGLYGVIAYVTALRTREIGIRMAIGADRRNVLWLVLRQAVPMVGPGLVVGVVLAFFLTPLLAVPFDFVPRDGRILALVPLLVSAAAVAACLVPARRAARVEPTIALRDE